MRLDDDSFSIDVGSFVMNNHHGLLRMGVVESRRTDDQGWTYYKVNFLEDEIYQYNKTFHSEISGRDEFQYEHRSDQITKVNPQWLQNVINAYEEIKND